MEIAQKLDPGADLAVQGDRLRAVGVVQGQHRGLRKRIGCAEAVRMAGVAFDLGRATHGAFHQGALRESAEQVGACEVQRLAGDDLLGWTDVRNDLLARV